MRKWPVNVEIRPTGINRIGGWRGGFDGCGNGGRIWKSALQELIGLDVGGEESMVSKLVDRYGNPPYWIGAIWRLKGMGGWKSKG